MAIIQVVTVRDETATWDEPQYLAAGYSYWTTGRYDMNPEHPPFTKLLCSLPLYLFYKPQLNTNSPEWQQSNFVMVGNLFLYRNTVSPDDLLFAGRLMTIGLAAFFALYTAWWTRRRFGAAVGLFALALLTLDPNIIAHGRYATNDLAVTCFIFATCTLWIEYLIEPRRLWILATGVSLGLALASKYSALFLAPVLLALSAIWVWERRAAIMRVTGALAAVALLSVCVIAILYWPEIWRTPELPPLSTTITRAGATGPILSILADRLRLPAYTFLTGIDWQARHNAVGHPAYLLGQVSTQGWWYYFPVAFAVKTPVAVLAGLALATSLMWRSDQKLFLALLLIPAVSYFGLTMLSHINLGIRSLLPVYPFFYVLLAATLLQPWRFRFVALAILLVAAVECASIYPDYLAFFNFAAGGPDAGPKYLLDSNIDWGQDFKKLGRYLNRQGTPEICLGFFANVDFPHYGIHPGVIPENATADSLDCVVAISATPLFGEYVGTERFAWLRALKPEKIIGHSIYVYDLRKPARTSGADQRTFKVQWNNSRIAEYAGGLDPLVTGQREVERTDFRDPSCAEVENRGSNREALRHFGSAFIPDCVAGKVDALLRSVGEAQRKADDGRAIQARWPVARWRGDYPQDRSILSGEFNALPGSQPYAVRAKPSGAFPGSEHRLGGGE